MLKFLCLKPRNLGVCLKNVPPFTRFYRTKHRKRVSVELNKPSLYDDKRNTPSRLLKANLFTPESAGFRELPMLCFWIVNYGYADSAILTRYVQCAIDGAKKLKIKGIALVFHAVSKYLHNTQISLLQPHEVDEGNAELKNREVLIRKCIEFILESSPLLPNLFVNAVPKDLGMISLSIVSIYETFLNECSLDDPTLEVEGDKTDKPDAPSIRSIDTVISKLFQRLSQEIIPKLPFCELDEFAAFAKAFSKINAEWAGLFMRELALEVSSLLMDRLEDLEMLRQNRFIGEDLIEQLNKLPRDLATLTCALSKCNVNESRFWDRAQKAVDLLLDLTGTDFGVREVDITTLTLLCTSMSNHANVTKIVAEMLRVSSGADTHTILVGFNTAARVLRDDDTAGKFLDKLDTGRLLDSNPKLVAQFIINFAASSLRGRSEVRAGILALLGHEVDREVACAMFVARRGLVLPAATASELCERLSRDLPNLETPLLANLVLSSRDMMGDERARNMCRLAVGSIYSRVDDIPLRRMPALTAAVLNNFGGNLGFIRRACKRIDEHFQELSPAEMVHLCDEASGMGLNVNKLFSRSSARLRELRESIPAAEEPGFLDPPQPDEDFDSPQFDSPAPAPRLQFAPNDPEEIAMIAERTLSRAGDTRMLSPEDFGDDEQPDEPAFELTKYPSNPAPPLPEPAGAAPKRPSGLATGATVAELRSEWSALRQAART